MNIVHVVVDGCPQGTVPQGSCRLLLWSACVVNSHTNDFLAMETEGISRGWDCVLVSNNGADFYSVQSRCCIGLKIVILIKPLVGIVSLLRFCRFSLGRTSIVFDCRGKEYILDNGEQFVQTEAGMMHTVIRYNLCQWEYQFHMTAHHKQNTKLLVSPSSLRSSLRELLLLCFWMFWFLRQLLWHLSQGFNAHKNYE